MSDIHFGHAKVIDYENRPFSDVKSMNEHIKEVLCDTIGENDILFDLGDMFWKANIDEARSILEQAAPLKFYKILGNHDSEIMWRQLQAVNSGKLVEAVGDIMDVAIVHEGVTYRTTLSHYPLISWNFKRFGSISLHGHMHGDIDKYNKLDKDLRVDLSWDGDLASKQKSGYSFLVDFETVLAYFEEKVGSLDFKTYAEINCKGL